MGIEQCIAGPGSRSRRRSLRAERSVRSLNLLRVCLQAAWIGALLLSPSPSAAQMNVSAAADRSIDLPVGQGRIIRFDQAVESVFIADPTIADLRIVSADVVYVFGKRTGVTNLMAMSADQKLRTSTRFRVVADVSPANDARRELQPTSTIEVSLFGTRAAVTGRARNIDEAVDAANVAQTYSPPGQPPINDTTIEGSQQVNIRVRFAEVSRADLQTIGFEWQIFANTGSLQVGGSFSGSVDVNVVIEALKRNGSLTILAEPNLTAVTGQTASFLAGGEIPVPVTQGRGEGITIQYKQFGVSLEFTPTIVKHNRIGLHVRPEVSALSRAGAVRIAGTDIPSLTVRRADTTVEVASGQTFAIAGLFQRQMSHDLDKFPGLGEVPVLGALFTSDRFRREETELVILITPYLVKPTRDRVARTPLDRPEAPAPAIIPRAPSPDRSSGLVFK
jgi:pilus assembly protein CpaC